MHPVQITADQALYNAQDEDGPTVADWYVYSDDEWHGPFEDGYAEACKFWAYCDAQDAAERRHMRSLGAGS